MTFANCSDAYIKSPSVSLAQHELVTFFALKRSLLKENKGK